MTKRILSLLLAIILICSVTGCASSKNDAKPSEGTNTEITEPSDTTPESTEKNEATEPSDAPTEENTTTPPTESNADNDTKPEETTPSQDTEKKPETPTNDKTDNKADNKTDKETTGTSTSDRVVVKDEDTQIKQSSNVGLQSFDGKMISYLEQEFGTNQNVFASPLSLKYVLAMNAIGAKGDTQKELLQVLGFKTVKECEDWASSYIETVKPLDNLVVQKPSEDGLIIGTTGGISPKTTLNIANSVWHNKDKGGKIKTTFMNAVNKACGAEVFNVNGNKMMDEMNAWVDRETNGMIQNMFDASVKEKNTILVNALYLKANWTSKFSKSLTYKDNFTCANGSIVQKDFMRNSRCHFNYYKDNETEFVIITLNDGIKLLCVKGSTENISTKLPKAKSTLMDLHIPKVEMETEFRNQELVSFLKANGVNKMFNASSADFSNMIDEQSIYVDDIVQKTKIKMDEDGLEASAVSASTSLGSSGGKVEEPIIVKFDEVFKFYVYNYNADGTTPEVLFYGNYAK